MSNAEPPNELEEVLNRLAKNEQIRKTRMATIARRKNMVCKTYELKFDKSHLSNETLEALLRLFLEAKWFYNDMLDRSKRGEQDVWDADYKRTEVRVKRRDGSFGVRNLKHLSSQMRQELVERAKRNIVGLSKLKRNGYRVGALRFKTRIASIPLRQYDRTHRVKDKKYIRIQNIKQPLKVMGLERIPKSAELTSAILEQRGDDYFLHVTTFQPKAVKESAHKVLGIDFGIAMQLTLSNGLDIEEGVIVTRSIRRTHRRLSRSKRYGKNWQKTCLRLAREYEKIGNQKVDIKNKLVSRLVSTYETIKVQDECVKGWQRMWGRRIQASAIGGIMSALKERAHTLVVVPRFVPTTKQCSCCGNIQEVGLEERTYHCCKCGLQIDRNFNSALNILNWNEGVPAERREFTPVDTKAATEMMEYFNGIPGVSASLVGETGSPRPSVVR